MTIKLKNPYLIQRMMRRKDICKNPSLDQLYQMDYMGSAEFEFGALPKSLKILTKNFGNLYTGKTAIENFKDEPLFLLGLKHIVKKYPIETLIKGKFHIKEHLSFDYAWKGVGVYGVTKYPFNENNHATAWWDIQNHVMFTFKKLHINKLKDAIGVVLENKISDKEKEWY